MQKQKNIAVYLFSLLGRTIVLTHLWCLAPCASPHLYTDEGHRIQNSRLGMCFILQVSSTKRVVYLVTQLCNVQSACGRTVVNARIPFGQALYIVISVCQTYDCVLTSHSDSPIRLWWILLPLRPWRLGGSIGFVVQLKFLVLTLSCPTLMHL